MSLTYFGKNNPLIETADFVPETISWSSADGNALTESEAKLDANSRMVLEGVVQRSDTLNLNKRKYPKSVWEKQLDEKGPVMRKLREKCMYGHLEHPENGTTDMNKVAILMTGLKMDEKGIVHGKLIVLNTPSGSIVKECVSVGGKVGISSRGTGSVDDKGVVQEDYAVETWDIVYNPSTPGATVAPTKTEESTEAPAAPLSEGTDMTLPVIPDGLELEEDKLPLTSIEQDLLIKGPDYVKSKTGISKPNDLAMVFLRFRKWAKQHGASYTELSQAWDSFAKLYPLVIGVAPEAKVPAGAEGKGGPTTHAAPSTEIPGITTIKTKEDVEAKPEQKVDESAVKLLEAAKTEIVQLTEAKTALEATVASLTEKNSKMTADMEASAAIVTEARATVASLKAKEKELSESLDRAVEQIATLTALDTAAQVRESVKDAINADKRLAPFKETLELCKTSVAVEAKAKELVATLTESAGAPPVPPKKPSLAERLMKRAEISDTKGLPKANESSDTKPLISEDNADDTVSETTLHKSTTKAGSMAKMAAKAAKKLNEESGPR